MAYVVPRDHFWMLICVVALLFLGYVPLVQAAKGFNLKQLLVVAALFRVAFIVSTPALSDDFYRFFWDGRMWWHGAHPLSATPDDLHTIKASEAWDPHQELWNGLNSREYSTVYPPASQFLFALAAGGGMRSVATELMLLRLLLVALELLAVYLLYLILPLLGRPPTAAAWYAFNPLVITEVAGNLHFEGAMTTCVLWAIWGWLASQPGRKAITWVSAMVLGVATKLLPLLLLPLLPRTVGWGKAIVLGLAVLAGCAAVFVPFLYTGGSGFGTSVELFVSQFEFNASIYYLARELGTWVQGYNPIGTLGPTLKVATAVVIVFLALRRKHTPASAVETALWMWAVYLFLATTVHPWYVVPLVALGTLSGRVWPWVWSGLLFFSYSHYHGGGFQEAYGWIAAEYVLLAMIIALEYRGTLRKWGGPVLGC